MIFIRLLILTYNQIKNQLWFLFRYRSVFILQFFFFLLRLYTRIRVERLFGSLILWVISDSKLDK